MDPDLVFKSNRSHPLMIKICIVLVSALFSASVTGGTIQIEPDDFSEGDDLSNVSPYVTLSRASGFKDQPSEPVYASASQFDFPAPTGNLTFGSYSGGWVECTDDVACYAGLALSFHQPVTSVSLLAINSGYPPGLSAVWSAFDTDGAVLENGSSSGRAYDNYGNPFKVTLQVPDMATLIIGGDVLTGAVEFDQLVIQVPEPGMWALFGLGVAGLYFKRRKGRAKAAS